MFWKLIRSRASSGISRCNLHLSIFWTFPSHPRTFKFQQNRRHGFCGARDGARVVESSIGRHHQSSILQSQRSSPCVLMGQGLYVCSSFSLLSFHSVSICIPLICVCLMMVLFRAWGCMMPVPMSWEESLCTLVPSSIAASTMIPPASVSPPTTLLDGHLLTLFFNVKLSYLSCSSPCDLVVLFFIPG